jgi:glycosyltransferase involved in cell wall biosynthesis
MRIAVISTFYPNAAEPLRAVFVRNLVGALGHHAQVAVVSPVPYAPPAIPVRRWRMLRAIPESAREEDREVLHPRYLVIPKCDWLSGLTYGAGIHGTLRTLAQRQPIDILHAHCGFPDAVGVACAAARLGLPFAVTLHGSDINVYGERPFIRSQMRWALRRAAVIIAVSKALCAKVVELVPAASERVVHIPCAGVDSRVFAVRDRAEARHAVGIEGDGRVVLFAGRLVTIKSVDTLLEAWERLRARGTVTQRDRLVIVGDGPERRRLEAWVAVAPLQGTVQFLGEIAQEQLACWLNAATAFCLPSRNEGTPNVVVEALASGCPVVASRVGGVPELIRDGDNGFLVEAGNAALLAESLGAALAKDWDAQRIADGTDGMSWDGLARRNLEALQVPLVGQQGVRLWAR